MKTSRLAAVLALAALSSCTTAGPFVTSISSDGRGNLIIEKSMVQYNSFMGTVSTEGTVSSSIKVVDISRSGSGSAPQNVWTGND